jgi:hypothetical protein
MSIDSLTVPWAAAPTISEPAPAMSGVDVLQGYTSAGAVSAGGTLTHPWSDQSLTGTRLPEVASLIRMALAE